jgi:hypothetical protein
MNEALGAGSSELGAALLNGTHECRLVIMMCTSQGESRTRRELL